MILSATIDGQAIALFVIGILLTCIGVLIASLVSNATKSFEKKINELMTLYGMTLEELAHLNKTVLRHEIKLERHEGDINNLKEKI